MGIGAEDVVDLTQQLAQAFVAGDGAGEGDQVGFIARGPGLSLEGGDCGPGGGFDAVAQAHGVGPGRPHAFGLGQDGAGQHRGGGSAIAHTQVHAPHQVTQQHRPHIFGAVGQLQHAAGNGRGVFQRFGRAGLVQIIEDQALAGAEGGGEGAAQPVEPGFESGGGVGGKKDSGVGHQIENSGDGSGGVAMAWSAARAICRACLPASPPASGSRSSRTQRAK